MASTDNLNTPPHLRIAIPPLPTTSRPSSRSATPSTPLTALYKPFHTNRRPDPDTPKDVQAEGERSAAEALESMLKRFSPKRAEPTDEMSAPSSSRSEIRREVHTPSPVEERKVVGGEYEIIETIGEGSYGKVKLAKHLPTGEKVALKFLNKHLIHTTRGTSERILREILVLAHLRHPNIVALLDVIQSSSNICLVLEHVGGGEMFDRVNKLSEANSGKGIGEDEARRVFRQVLSAVEYGHGMGIVHRDLKLENLLVDEANNIKIIDYGFATPDDSLLDTFCGSIAYASPEMLCSQKYAGTGADVWSMGVILYTMVCGKMPFDERNVKRMLVNMLEKRFDLPDYVSDAPSSANQSPTQVIIPELEEQALARMVQMGYNKDEVVHWLQDGQEEERVGRIAAAWFLVQR
ncbi:Protein kinase [Rhizophlyctis rosea]|nr:Protein kinase [Rhizophlyctis rosea]